ncbi:MAG TPA: WD40 repeat domain-containing protein, partial [Pyrinomonadaceae bacterium]
GDDKRIRLWNVADGTERKSLLDEAKVQSAAYSPDGRWFATSDEGNTFSLWDSTTYARWRSPEARNTVTTVAFSPDKRTMATGDADGIVRLWDVEGRRLLYTCAGHGGIIVSLSYGPDGRVLASGSDDGTVILWEAEGGRKLRSLVGHTSVVHEVAFSPDGRTLASSGFDGSTRLWDPESAQVRATLVVTDVSGNWLVVMPNGLFDGSSAAWSQLLWRFSPRLYDVKTVEVFFNDFFRPGLLADVADVRPPAAPREIQNIDRRQPSVRITTAARLAEEGDVAVAEKGVAVGVEVAEAPPGDGYPDAGGGARDVRLFRNGLLVKVWRGDALDGSSGCQPLGQGRARCEARVGVVAGENRLAAYAFNRQNVKSADAEAVVDGGAADSSRQSTLYILAVGINRYQNHEFDLKYAVPDAQDFGAELNLRQKGLSQFRRREVIPLYNERASKDGIVSALNSLKDRVRPEDTVAIYFAGHGVSHDKHFVLVPHDLGYAGKRDDLDESGLG